MLNIEISQIIVQIIGFLTMFWVLKKYGWKPVLERLKARQEKIREEFASIAVQKEEAALLNIKYEKKLKEIEAEKRKKIQMALDEGQKISLEIQQDAHAKAKEILQKGKIEMESEVAKAKVHLKNDMVNLVMIATHKILNENLDALSQKKLIDSFIDEALLK